MPWKKGETGNPGGRPSMPEELKSKLKKGADEAVAFWLAALSDDSMLWQYRNKAAENIVQYAYGKPKEIIDVDVEGRFEGFTINVVHKTDA